MLICCLFWVWMPRAAKIACWMTRCLSFNKFDCFRKKSAGIPDSSGAELFSSELVSSASFYSYKAIFCNELNSACSS